jgi:hypothetical protein
MAAMGTMRLLGIPSYGLRTKNLSVNNIYFPWRLPESDNDGGNHHQGSVASIRFFVAHQELTKAIEPGVAGFDDPATGFVIRVPGFHVNRLTSEAYMGHVVSFFHL